MIDLTFPPIRMTQRGRQTEWQPRVIKALGLTAAPIMSAEHERLLDEATKAGLNLNASTATAWYTDSLDRQAVLIVEAGVTDEEAVRQAALMPEYVVSLPYNIAPNRPSGPWFALCETNWAAYDLREQLRVMRLWL